ncbi:DUF305 domain-containing protein [Luteitalea sp.]|jgi:uncharacterized protein (DUF305 family)|uniref:DUF305 domain-containing protein n=1 Tax=Luteitalea sp. TaxID=2004800 RepID=UPI0025C5571A|nr:DUF305 domain-containing protein [Luteitalea sp.]
MLKPLIAVFTMATVVPLSVPVQTQTPAGTGHAKHAQTSKSQDHSTMTDAEFVAMTIKHHQDGIEMAGIEEKGGASNDVKALAARIRQGQERELAELQKHQKSSANAGSGGHAMHMKEMEADSQRAMTRLRSAPGSALDHAFADEMAKHHQQAIDMVGRTKFTDTELRAMAQKMAASQKQELGELKKHQKSSSH